MTAFSEKKKSNWFHTVSNPTVIWDLKNYKLCCAWHEICISLPNLPMWNLEAVHSNQEPGALSL